MFGFGKHKEEMQPVEVAEDEIRVTTIPEPFYGARGNAPVSAKRVPETTVSPSAPKTGAHTPPHAAPAHKKRKWVLIGIFVFVLLGVIGGATWWYTRDLISPPPAPIPVAPIVEVVPVEPVEEVVDVPDEEEEEPEVELPKTLLTVLQPLADTIDFDSDNLTDIEEELYSGDISDGDTDKDGFLDGLEIIHLYDPTSSSPALLIDSGDVQVYTNTTYTYSMVYPIDWLAAPVNQEDPDEVLFTSLTGEFVSMRHFAFSPGETFVAWLNVNNPQVVFSSLKQWTNRMGNTGWFETHRQRYYFANTDGVYVLQYNPGLRSAINFRQTMRMMAESWNPEVAESQDELAPLPGIQEGVTSTPPVDVATSSIAVPEDIQESASTTPFEL